MEWLNTHLISVLVFLPLFHVNAMLTMTFSIAQGHQVVLRRAFSAGEFWEVVDRYKEMAEIERGWRSLKSTLLLRPVFHWTERRIRAHVFVCVLALQLERWMRLKLRPVSVPRALSELARIKVGELELDGKKSLVVTRPTDEQKEWLASLGVLLHLSLVGYRVDARKH